MELAANTWLTASCNTSTVQNAISTDVSPGHYRAFQTGLLSVIMRHNVIYFLSKQCFGFFEAAN